MNKGWTYTGRIDSRHAGATLLDYLLATRRHSSSEEWLARIDRREIEVNGAPVGAATVLRAGQSLVWHRPPWIEPDVPLHFDVLHEDEAIVAVVKPSGLPTMPAGGFLEHTLFTLVRHQFPEASPLHRLGRFTSGIVLFARTRDAAARLSAAWRRHEVKKHYRALACGVAGNDRFEIDTPIGPVPHPRLGTVHAASVDGRPAHSIAWVLERRADSTLFAVEISTGRPHQIRIHLASVGHPLVGDPVYAPGGGLKPNPGVPGDGGYLLHAERIGFVHPISNAWVEYAAEPPRF